MRIFYVFKINDEIAKMTKNKPENIYDSLEQIYFMDKNKTIEGKNLLESISNRFNKENINSLLKDIYRDNIYYNCYNNIHILLLLYIIFEIVENRPHTFYHILCYNQYHTKNNTLL